MGRQQVRIRVACCLPKLCHELNGWATAIRSLSFVDNLGLVAAIPSLLAQGLICLREFSGCGIFNWIQPSRTAGRYTMLTGVNWL